MAPSGCRDREIPPTAPLDGSAILESKSPDRLSGSGDPSYSAGGIMKFLSDSITYHALLMNLISLSRGFSRHVLECSPQNEPYKEIMK